MGKQNRRWKQNQLLFLSIILPNHDIPKGQCEVDLDGLTGEYPPLLIQRGEFIFPSSRTENDKRILAFGENYPDISYYSYSIFLIIFLHYTLNSWYFMFVIFYTPNILFQWYSFSWYFAFLIFYFPDILYSCHSLFLIFLFLIFYISHILFSWKFWYSLILIFFTPDVLYSWYSLFLIIKNPGIHILFHIADLVL